MSSTSRTSSHRAKITLFGSAIVLRLLLALAFPALRTFLAARAEISTPVNGFKRLKEGLFLYERGLDPYDGGIFHQAPLLLPLFSLMPSQATRLGLGLNVLIFALLDVGIASCLFEIAASGAAVESRLYTSKRKDRAWRPLSIAAFYLYNPFTLLVNLGQPTSIFMTFCTMLSIRHACSAKLATSAFALAIATYLGLHPVLLLLPIVSLCYDHSEQRKGKKSTSHTRYLALFGANFTFALGTLLLLSRALMPSWKFIPAVYATLLKLPDLTPNTGVWWYFFIEMFDAFRSFFLGVFWLHMLSYSVPFYLRLNKQPLAAIILMMGVVAIFEPYANIGNVGAWLSSLCLLGHVFDVSSMHRYTFPAVAALLYGTFLGPAFHYLWIYAGSGNANFFYAITLVWSLALLILLTDTLYATLRDEWEAERPEGTGKEIRQL